MKRLRLYRIPIIKDDQINISMLHKGKTYNGDSNKIFIVNVSSQGCAIALDKEISGECELSISVQGKKFELHAKLNRVATYNDNRELFLLGFEFTNIDDDYGSDLVETILRSFNSSRLRKIMMEMIQNEGQLLNLDARPNSTNEMELSSSIVFDLYYSFFKHVDSNKLVGQFAREVKRNINCENFAFYKFENNFSDVSTFNFSADEQENSLLPVTGALAKVRDCERGFSGKASKNNADPFFNLIYALYDKDVRNYILWPIFSTNGKLLGVVEFSNTINKEDFTQQAIQEVAIFSRIISSSFYSEVDESISKTILKYEKLIAKNFLIGPSEKNRYLNSQIVELAKSDQKVLVCGEYGVGKEQFAINIHRCSERSEFSVGEFNCNHVQNKFDIDSLLDSKGDHTGLLELYNGGTLIFKDINVLSYSLGEYLFNKIKNITHIRFMATTCASSYDVNKFSESYQPLDTFFREQKIDIPSLRERPEDIVSLATFFAINACKENGLAFKKIGSEILDHFVSYDWPGNINELKIAVERLIMLDQDLDSLNYKKTRILPLTDREIDNDFFYGIELNHDLIDDKTIFESGSFEELYFYFYVDSLLTSKECNYFQLSEIFDMSRQELDEKIYHAHMIAIEYFGSGSKEIEPHITTKAA